MTRKKDLKTEIKIILEKGSSNKTKGNCFEDLIRKLLTTHQYEIRGNINFSGMEIDLIAEHKHKRETLYVECKAKEKVSSDELSKFCFNVEFKEADFGYFFRTQDLEFQAGALLSEIRKKEKYKNLTFFEPNDIIRILTDAKLIVEPNDKLKSFSISKRFLAVTYFGDYLIYIIDESNLIPSKFIIVDAQLKESFIDDEKIGLLKDEIGEIKNLNLIENASGNVNNSNQIEIENISEVQESENWFDYLPASSERNHFVGRDYIRTKILEYFKEIQTNKSLKRIFFLNGKSGWGKSSLILEIKERCRNKHYKNKFFAIAIDTRSATSDNFVALSFNKIINSAYEHKFLERDMFDQTISFTSNTDLFSSSSIKTLLKKLESEDKYLVLIFDQFEDVFRKRNFFKSFYKFLTDVTDRKPNLIIGFSWKSEFFVPSEDPNYHYWQQSKDQAKEFTVGEFGEKEIDGIIGQLEGSIGKIEKEIKNRIKDSSHSLPWLTKKLCIHIFEQIEAGLEKDKLIESNFNIRDLFEKDKEQISGDELTALKYIAQRAYEGNFFDISEVGDSINNNTIDSLIHKRLIIKSGANFNIYWDIFRDYLVTNVIPPIGETYLLRQGVNLCLEVFLLFEDVNKRETVNSLLEKHPKDIGKNTIENTLIELRNFGLVKKDNEFYVVAKKDIEVSKEGFVKYTTEKLKNYTPYLSLKKMNLTRISKDDILKILKQTYKQKFKDDTLEGYAKNTINWFLFSDIDIKSKIVEPTKGRGLGNSYKHYSKNTPLSERDSVLPNRSINEILTALKLYETKSKITNVNVYSDLRLLGIIDEKKDLTDFGINLIKNSDRSSKLIKKILELPKMQELEKVIGNNPPMKLDEIIKKFPSDFFHGQKLITKKVAARKALSWLK